MIFEQICITGVICGIAGATSIKFVDDVYGKPPVWAQAVLCTVTLGGIVAAFASGILAVWF